MCARVDPTMEEPHSPSSPMMISTIAMAAAIHNVIIF
jgi:hypothetical protein